MNEVEYALAYVQRYIASKTEPPLPRSCDEQALVLAQEVIRLREQYAALLAYLRDPESGWTGPWEELEKFDAAKGGAG